MGKLIKNVSYNKQIHVTVQLILEAGWVNFLPLEAWPGSV